MPVEVVNTRGHYVPAIPEPFYLRSRNLWRRLRGRWDRRCDCGSIYRSRQRYEEHYAHAHVLAYRQLGEN